MTPDARHAIASDAPTASAPQAVMRAAAVAVACFIVAGSIEAVLIGLLRPTEMELDWISDALLSAALGVAVYMWLHLRATRVALTEREKAQVVLQAQLSLAESLQRRLLPEVPERARGVEWAAELVSAGRIGGDFYDFVQPAADIQLILIADVSGKGIAAAMALTLLRSTFRRLAQDTNAPSQLASRMSAALHDEWGGSPYVTAIIARLDLSTRVLTYTNAGHPRGIVLRGREEIGMTEGGPPLGLLKHVEFAEAAIPLRPEDVCVLVTDGVSEALESTTQSWCAAVVASIGSERQSARNICRAVVSVAQSGGGPSGIENWSDDRTVIVGKIVARPS